MVRLACSLPVAIPRKEAASLDENHDIERNPMKREASTPTKISNAVLATRYLALQELRERVRRAEQRFASTHLKKVSILETASGSDAHMRPRNRKP
jgi:hypothetical protein